MSKQRQVARAQREAAAAARAEQQRAERERQAAARARRDRRAERWRRLRLWQAPTRRETRERTVGLLTLVALVLLAVFVATGSLGTTLLVALVLIVVSPVLVLLFFDRRSR